MAKFRGVPRKREEGMPKNFLSVTTNRYFYKKRNLFEIIISKGEEVVERLPPGSIPQIKLELEVDSNFT